MVKKTSLYYLSTVIQNFLESQIGLDALKRSLMKKKTDLLNIIPDAIQSISHSTWFWCFLQHLIITDFRYRYFMVCPLENTCPLWINP